MSNGWRNPGTDLDGNEWPPERAPACPRCSKASGIQIRREFCFCPEPGSITVPLPLAQRILDALDYFAAEGWVAARECAAELRVLAMASAP